MTEGLKAESQNTVKKLGIAVQGHSNPEGRDRQVLGLPTSLGEVQASERLCLRKIKDGWC